jgi:hypothetical protein
MSSWATLVAASGFHYSGVERCLTLTPRISRPKFRSFWSAPSGWGMFAQAVTPVQQKVNVEPAEGSLAVAQLVVNAGVKGATRKLSARLGAETLTAKLRSGGKFTIDFGRELNLTPSTPLQVTVTV